MAYAYLFAPAAAVAVAWVAQRFLQSGALATITLDYPNQRSLHLLPTPRTGGIAVALGIGAGWLLSPPAPWLPALSVAALALCVISLVDDMRGLSAGLRLTAHFAAGAAFLAALGIGWNWVLLLALPLVWGVNLYNFMDGLDGLAAGMAVLGFGAYAVLACVHGSAVIATLSLCVAAAALGFLPSNFAPAKAFLGDAGSVPLGFIAGAIGIAGWHDGTWELWFPLLVFSPFIVDASVTLAKRAAGGARLTEAHREHYYQRVARLGFGHRNTALLEYALMLAAAAAAVIAAAGRGLTPAIALTGLGVLEIGCLVAVDKAWRRKPVDNGQYQQRGPRA